MTLADVERALRQHGYKTTEIAEILLCGPMAPGDEPLAGVSEASIRRAANKMLFEFYPELL